MSKVVIIGAGIAGLSTGYHAQEKGLDYIIFEKNAQVGGLCRTIKIKDFYFDYSGHFLHLKKPSVQTLVKDLLGDNLSVIKRNSFIFSCNVFTRYPFQANLYGLPPPVVKECLLEFVKAYIKSEMHPISFYNTFYDWINSKFGKGIGKHFMFPYNEKLWTIPTKKLTCEWLSEYVPVPNLEDVFNGAFSDQKKAFGYNASFFYPKKGGIQVLCDALYSKTQNIKLKERLVKVDLKKRVVEFESGNSQEYKKLISSVPLKKLIEDIIKDVPYEIEKAANKLKHNSVVIINLGVKEVRFPNKHWIYLPEKKYLAYRMGVYSNLSEFMAPPEMTSYYLEAAYQKSKSIDKESLIENVVADVIEMGFIKEKNDIIVKHVIDLEYAYVIYDKYYSKCRKIILDYLAVNDIYCIGRYGMWEYSDMEAAIEQGKRVVEKFT